MSFQKSLKDLKNLGMIAGRLNGWWWCSTFWGECGEDLLERFQLNLAMKGITIRRYWIFRKVQRKFSAKPYNPFQVICLQCYHWSKHGTPWLLFLIIVNITQFITIYREATDFTAPVLGRVMSFLREVDAYWPVEYQSFDGQAAHRLAWAAGVYLSYTVSTKSREMKCSLVQSQC